MRPHVIQDKWEYTWLNWLSTSRIPIELWPINHCQDPRTLKTILITVTLPSYKKNVPVLSRRLSRAPLKLRAVIYNNDSANGKQNNQNYNITKVKFKQSKPKRKEIVSDCNV